MNKLSHDEVDALRANLNRVRRSDLARYVPLGGTMMFEAPWEFWTDVASRFSRGEWQDAVTEIERRFESRRPKKTDAQQMAWRAA